MNTGDANMKILPFNPQAANTPQARNTPRTPAAPRPGAPEARDVSSFEAELRQSGRLSPTVVDKIGSENRLASHGAIPADVDAAGSLLSSLLADIRSAGPEALKKVHDIDGILYYYQL